MTRFAWLGTPERRFGALAWLLCGLAFAAGQQLAEDDSCFVALMAAAAGLAASLWAAAEKVGWHPIALIGADRPVATLSIVLSSSHHWIRWPAPNDPAFARPRRLTGTRRDIQTAGAGLEKLARRDPRNAGTLLRLGIARDLAGDSSGAERAWLAAERLAPRSSAGSTNLALACAKAGRWDDATAAARRALRRDPRTPRPGRSSRRPMEPEAPAVGRSARGWRGQVPARGRCGLAQVRVGRAGQARAMSRTAPPAPARPTAWARERRSWSRSRASTTVAAG